MREPSFAPREYRANLAKTLRSIPDHAERKEVLGKVRKTLSYQDAEESVKERRLEATSRKEDAMDRPEAQEFQEIRERERERLNAFFGKEFLREYRIEVPAVPRTVTPERIAEWQENLFELRYLPKVRMEESMGLPGWRRRPHWYRRRDGETTKETVLDAIRRLPENQQNPRLHDLHSEQLLDPLDLPGAWMLVDTRGKPSIPYQEGGNRSLAGTELGPYEYDHDRLVWEILSGLSRLSHQQGRFDRERWRGGIKPSQFDPKAQFWRAFQAALRQGLHLPPRTVLRLPRLIEDNVLNQDNGWGKTGTSEWCEERFSATERVKSGSKYSGGPSEVSWHWDGSENWGFRPVVVFP